MPVALLALYFLHAFYQTFPMTAYGDWLFDVIHMPPATTTIYYSVAFFPWNLKPFYGLLSDTLPVFGYHRKSYIVLCEIGAALSLICTGAYVNSIAGAFIVRVLDAVFEAFAQIMLGIFLVDLAVGDPTSTTSATVQSLANGTKNVASIAALVLGIPVYKDKNITPQQVISWTSLMPLIAASVCLLGLYEAPTVASTSAASSSVRSIDHEESFWNSVRSSWRAFKRDLKHKLEVLLPVLPAMLFFFLCSALPGDGMVWYQYTFSLLGDQLECMQYMSLAGMIGRFLSCCMYARWCSGRNVRHVFLASTVASVVAGLPRLLLAPPMAKLPVSVCTFSTVESLITSFTSEFALLQLLVVATFYCPQQKNVRGLTYALYLSFMDFGGVISGLLTSVVVDALGIVVDSSTQNVNWDHLWVLVVISASGQLLVLVFLYVLPDKVHTESNASSLDRTTECDPLLETDSVRV